MPDWHSAKIVTEEGEEEVMVEASAWHSIYQNVADHLIKGTELAVTAQDVRSAIQVIDAAFLSSETGEVVRIGGKH